MITESMVYWITRLDYIRGLCVGISLISLVLAVFTAVCYGGSCDKCESIRVPAVRVCVRLLIVDIILALIGIGGMVLVPSTQEMAMIKFIPAVSSSEFVSEKLPADVRQIYELGKQRLIKELKGGCSGQK